MQPLRLTLVQADTRWHDAASNRAYYRELLHRHGEIGDLVVLPEMFLTGFTNETDSQAEPLEGPGLEWMRARAAECDAVVTGSLVIRREDGQSVNRLLWVRPDGSFAQYDKRHLFRMAGEHHHYAAGASPLTIELHGWRVRPLVCYDLRFPVWSRNRRCAGARGGMDYDVLLYVANWPAPRRTAWRTLLRARAIENLGYCVGVNRVGTDGNDVPYAGDSAAIDPLGESLVELGEQELVVTVSLDPESLMSHRQRFPAWMDADTFTLGEPVGPDGDTTS
ncbi:amidohydrolase [Oleiagrimonas sp. MCCC 1A03011]|uniref:amidohydrolase n=1 Tax=Oleiagrimonas sp. MCCC 1A03011 TaxID=1926883 RepID=UPI000DC24579|nr:amidohydrolase [Oleiagrimonas sp. MCCC 1A03011]RAP57803.1 amidohydrolase [Oleiagrimonas sp. MCCC 1A03011]